MNLYKILTATLCFLCLGSAIHAQNVISGKVTEKSSNEPLIGATVYVVNSNERIVIGTLVSFNGEYKMVVPSGEGLKIVCSFIGYKTVEVPYTGQSVLDMQLDSDTKMLLEAVVTGKRKELSQLGLTQREISSATQTLDFEQLEDISSTSLEDVLQGRMANVDIITGADPGSRSTIRIRGTSSLNASSEPLIVVDGVPYPTDISDDFNFSTADSEDFGALVNISPADIESIEVLKDAAATAVWGSKGANGVLLIKTKKGTSGKTRFNFSSKNDIRFEPNTIPMLDASQYVALVQDAIWNTVNDEGYVGSQDLLALLYDTQEIGFDPDWAYFDEYNQNTNWLDEITQVGFSTDNSFSMTGGGERATYRLSLGYLDQAGTTIGTGFQRISSMLSIKYRFSNKLDITNDFSFSNADKDSYYSNPRGHALTKMPNMSPYYINEDGSRSHEYFTPNSYFQGSWDDVFNPSAMVNESINNTTSTNSRFTFKLHYQIYKDLNFYSTTGFDFRNAKNKKYLPQSVTGVTWTDGDFNLSSDALTNKLYIYTENKLIYNKRFLDHHKVVATVLAQTNQNYNASYYSEVSGNASSSISDPTGGGNISGIGSGTSMARQLGFIGNVHYSLFDRYMINLGYRREANSTMGANQRWAGFPSVGVAWHLGDEAFMQSINSLSMAKLRFSWGQSGNAPSGSYSYIGAFNPITPGYIDMSAVEPTSIQLDNLKWETVTQTNIGLDLGMFNDRLNMTFDLYEKVTTDMLQKSVGLPTSSGFTKTNWYNSGSMSNKGWEFRVDYNVIKKKDFSLTTTMNVSRNRNEILELPDNLTDYKYDFGNGEYAYKVIEGNPLGSFYGYKYLGVYQNESETYARDTDGNLITDINGEPVIMSNGGETVYAGDAKYKDMNGDGIINRYDIVYLGNSNPLFNGGGGFTVKYKGWSLNTFFHGRAGQKVVNQMRIKTENMYGTSNQSTAVLRRWRHEGDDTEIPRALYGKGYNYLGSDRFVEDASFLRLKNLTLKYSFSKEVLHKLKLNKLDVYVTGYDLYTWTKYTGQDPEVSLSSDDGVAYLIAKDNASTPRARRFSLGINLGF